MPRVITSCHLFKIYLYPVADPEMFGGGEEILHSLLSGDVVNHLFHKTNLVMVINLLLSFNVHTAILPYICICIEVVVS